MVAGAAPLLPGLEGTPTSLPHEHQMRRKPPQLSRAALAAPSLCPRPAPGQQEGRVQMGLGLGLVQPNEVGRACCPHQASGAGRCLC